MNIEQIDSFLFPKSPEHAENDTAAYTDHYVEQYRLYLHIFNNTGDRRQKSNEFFLGLNTAIIGMLGYIESKNLAVGDSVIFLVAPFVGIGICFCWYQFIESYKQLSRAKFNVIHRIESRLPLALFETEWEILGRGKDSSKYRRLSSIEKNIPIIFIVLYIFIFVANLPWNFISIFFK